MKILTSFLILACTCMVMAEESFDPSKSTIQVFELADDTFYSELDQFYSKFHEVNEESLEFISSKMIRRVPNQYIDPSPYTPLSKQQKLFLVGKTHLNSLDVDYYLVCVLQSHGEFLGHERVETRLEYWIQGKRRFDAWRKIDNEWKVILGVDLESKEHDLANERRFYIESKAKALMDWQKGIDSEIGRMRQANEIIYKSMKEKGVKIINE